MNPTSLTSALTNMRSAESLSQIQIAVAARMLKMSNQQGQAVARLVESAGQTMEQAAGQVASLSSALGSSLDLVA